MSEYHEQCKLFEWARLAAGTIPELHLLNASLNGVKLSIGSAVKCKRMGMKKGFPDIFLPVYRDGYYGLFIEMKFGKNKLTEEQQKWREWLAYQGYFFKVCNSCDDAVKTITGYLLNLNTEENKRGD
jgi:hypothetical protein